MFVLFFDNNIFDYIIFYTHYELIIIIYFLVFSVLILLNDLITKREQIICILVY